MCAWSAREQGGARRRAALRLCVCAWAAVRTRDASSLKMSETTTTDTARISHTAAALALQRAALRPKVK